MFAALRKRLKKRKWLRGALRLRGGSPGVMDGYGGHCKVVLHTEGVQRGKHGRDGNAHSLARYVVDRGIAYHLVIDYQGRIAQCYTPDQGSRALLAGAWSPNRHGKRVIQICLAGVAEASDVKYWPMKNWDKVVDWCEAWGVPSKPITNFDKPTRSVAKWNRSGWTCHAAAPMNDHVDGRGAPIKWLLGEARARR